MNIERKERITLLPEEEVMIESLTYKVNHLYANSHSDKIRLVLHDLQKALNRFTECVEKGWGDKK